MTSVKQVLLAVTVMPVFALILACGPGAQPTATPTAKPAPTATATKAPAALPTSTLPGPAATPTPTSVAVPTATPTPGEQPRKGGTLNVVESGTIVNWDSYLRYDPISQNQIGKVYNNLFVNYSGNKIDCEICSEAGWRLEDNGKTMVFNIQPGIKFHSGKEMTSADVAYSIRMIMGEIDGIVSARVGVVKEYVDKIETPNKYELRIKLIRPSIFVPKILSASHAVIYEEGTTREMLKNKPYGSGPFLLKEFVSGASATYDRNPNYFKPGLPYLDKVTWTVATDADTQWAAFFVHKAEYKAQMEEPVDQFLATIFKMRDEGKITYIQSPGAGGYYGTFMVGSKPPFNDIRMRQAVNLAMDRVEIGKGTFGDRYKPQIVGGFTPETEFGMSADQIWNVLPGWGTGAKKQQEIDQAKKLLADAGFPNGIDLPMFRSTTAAIGYAAGPEILQSELKQIGMRTTLDTAKDTTDFAARLANFDYLFQIYIFYQITRDPDEAIGQYQITGGSRNPTGYSNPQVDKLFVQMSSEGDPVKRKQVLFQIQDIILKDLWYAPAAVHDGFLTFWPTIKGVEVGLTPAFHSGFTRADKQWLKP